MVNGADPSTHEAPSLKINGADHSGRTVKASRCDGWLSDLAC